MSIESAEAESVNDIQRYLGEEMIEQHRGGAISRREMFS